MRNFNQQREDRGRFKSDGRGSSRNNFGHRDRNDRGQTTMHKTTCDSCHETCEVPFRPSGDKPVYCSSCFENRRPEGDRTPRRDSDRKPDRHSKGDKNTERQFETMITKIDQLVDSINRLADSMTKHKIDKTVKSKSESDDKPIATPKKKPIKKASAKKAPTKKTKKVKKS